jgi:hypothetical protein
MTDNDTSKSPLLTMKYFKARVGELSDTTTAEVCSSLTETLEYESPFPDYLHIRNMEDHPNSIPFFKDVAERASKGVLPERKGVPQRFCLDPDHPDIPNPLNDRIRTMRERYSEWHHETSIQENFSDDDLTFKLAVYFDQEATPDSLELIVTFEMWGLPESQFPEKHEIVGETPPSQTSNHTEATP